MSLPALALVPLCVAVACAGQRVQSAERLPATAGNVRYCLSVATEHNVPRCIHELGAAQQRRAESAFRLVSAASGVVRLEVINGRGHPAEDPPGTTTSDYEYRSGLVSAVVEKDRGGITRRRTVVTRVGTELRWLDAAGRPQVEAVSMMDRCGHRASGVTRVLDAQGRIVAEGYVDAKGERTTSVACVAEVRFVRDPRGAVVDEAYFDETGRSTVDRRGVHRVTRTLDALGQARLERFLDASGRPVARADGVHAVQRKFDGVGNLRECAHEGLDGRPIRSGEDGAATYLITRDKHGAEVSRTYLDETGKPVLSSHGYVSRRTVRNATGVPVQWSYFDAQGRPAPLRDRVHSVVRSTVDGDGRILAEAYFDAGGRPMTVPDGHHRIQLAYDTRGNLISVEFQDTHGKRVVTRRGYAIERREYDVDRLVRVRHFGAEDQPVIPAHRPGEAPIHHAREIFYDELGGLASERWSGVEPSDSKVAGDSEPSCDPKVDYPVADAEAQRLLSRLDRAPGGLASAPSRRIRQEVANLSREVVRRLLASIPNRTVACGSAIADAIGSVVNARVRHRTEDGQLDEGMRLSFRTAVGKPARWAATVSFWGDGVYVFEERAAGPMLVMTVDSDARGQEATTARLSSPDTRGAFFLVTAHGVPREGHGVWRDLTWRVWEPGPSPLTPRKVFEEHSQTRLEDDEAAHISTSATGFTVSFESWDALADRISRGHVRSYVRQGRRFERVQPFTQRARDLPDEWVRLPWAEALRLNAEGAEEGLRVWHERLRAKARSSELGDMLAFDAESPVSEAERPWVRFRCERWVKGQRAPACKNLPERVTFRLVRDGPGFRLAGVEGPP